MLISTWPDFSYRAVRSVQLLLLLLLLMVFSSENFGFSPPYAGIAGIGPGPLQPGGTFHGPSLCLWPCLWTIKMATRKEMKEGCIHKACWLQRSLYGLLT